MFLVSIIGFQSVPDTVALSENIFDVALWGKIQDGRHLSKVKQ